jgi:threonine dehydrogenase-like Zn-dependent dehydrogenase
MGSYLAHQQRLLMAAAGGAEVINFSDTDVYDELNSRTAERGPDRCIDAVGVTHPASLEEAPSSTRSFAMRRMGWGDQGRNATCGGKIIAFGRCLRVMSKATLEKLNDMVDSHRTGRGHAINDAGRRICWPLEGHSGC